MTATSLPTRTRTRTAPPRRRDQRQDSRRPRGAAPLATRRRVPGPQPHDWFATQLLLVLSGQRPVHALLGHTRGPAYDQLVRLAPQAPLRPVGRGHRAPEVQAVGAFQPSPGAVEVFARIASGRRLRAMAFRLEYGRNRRWLCSAVELDTDGR